MIEPKTDLKKGKIMKISSMAWAGFAAVIIAATPALAAEDSKALIPGDFSANVGVFSDYTFRGISQTGDEPAAQGGIDYSPGRNRLQPRYRRLGRRPLSRRLGIECRFQRRRRGLVEIDWYGGLSKSFGGVDASIGFIYYSYPGASGSLNYDFIEGNLALGYQINDIFSVGFGYNASPDNFGDSGAAHYFSGSLSYAVSTPGVGLILDASVGRQLIEDNAAFGTPDYWDWRIGASLALTPNISISAFYTDTDISTADCGSENCDARG